MILHVPRQPASMSDLRRQAICGAIVKERSAPLGLVPLDFDGVQVLPTRSYYRGYVPNEANRCTNCYKLCIDDVVQEPEEPKCTCKHYGGGRQIEVKDPNCPQHREKAS